MTTGDPEVGREPGAVPIGVRTRYERFPATVKGAFVLRGADGNPHGVVLVEAAVARVPTGPAVPLALGDVVVDVAPGRDLFVPFEAPVLDLPPGWYSIRSVFRVDAGRTWTFAGRPFAVAWSPRENRRGTLRLDRTLHVGGREVMVDRVEMAQDRCAVIWRVPEGEEAGADLEVSMTVDGRKAEIVPDFDSSPGPDRRTVFYPVPRSASLAQVSVRLRSGPRSEPIDVPLS